MSIRVLRMLFVVFAAASLIHFIHNAEFLADYPGLPKTWTRLGVYGAWFVMILVGISGWLLIRLGDVVAGLVLVAMSAVGGLDSLGHYLVAPLSAHTSTMNATILLEVGAAALLLIEALRQIVMRRYRTSTDGRA